jgi:hypothetical protein
MRECSGCGAEVVMMLRLLMPPSRTVTSRLHEGTPIAFDRIMTATPEGLAARQHLCRDYLAWYQPADPRGVDEIPDLTGTL